MLAFFLRISFVTSSADWLEFSHPLNGMDVDLLWQSAIELNTVSPEQPRFALMQASAPTFTFFLALTQKTLGLSLIKHRLLMCFIGSLTVFVLMMTIWSWQKNTLTTFVTGLLAATYPATVYFDTQIIKVSLELLIIALLSLWLVRLKCSTIKQAILHGTCLSGLVLVLIASQFAAIFFPLAIVLWIMVRTDIPVYLRTTLITTMLTITAIGGWQLQHPERWMPDEYGAFLPVSAVHMAVGFHHRRIRQRIDSGFGRFAIAPRLLPLPDARCRQRTDAHAIADEDDQVLRLALIHRHRQKRL